MNTPQNRFSRWERVTAAAVLYRLASEASGDMVKTIEVTDRESIAGYRAIYEDGATPEQRAASDAAIESFDLAAWLAANANK